MPRTLAYAAAALAAALSFGGQAFAQAVSPPATHPGSSIYGLAAPGDYAVVETGAQAPDFSFESSPGWKHLHDLRAQGHVLLLVAPDEQALVELELERPQLLGMGVLPVAVLDRRATACRALAARLHLGFTVACDTKRVIGGQLNAVDPASGGDVVAWFVIGHDGRVRDMGHGAWPSRPWHEVCASALGLPAADAPMPASYPR